VDDTGPGIPPEVEDLLFKPFAQADSTLSRRFRGTGLGLAISLRLARAMGGDITLLSSPGKGSTFTFRLPCEVAPPPGTSGTTETPTDTTPEPPEPAEDRRPVLLVDDDHVSILLTGKILADLGYAIDVATGGQEALDAFQRVSRLEGIIPALETAHAFAYLETLCPQLTGNPRLVINSSGRGDKDVNTVAKALGGLE
jgi:hypothetical protein